MNLQKILLIIQTELKLICQFFAVKTNSGRVKSLKLWRLCGEIYPEITMSTNLEKKHWSKDTQEHKVESFYTKGVENYGDFHNGYLNFGLWEEGIKEYVKAAENLVHRIGTILGLNENSELLDVACGMGTQDIYISNKFSPRCIDAIDLVWKHIEHAIQRVREMKYENKIRFHHGTATQLPFPNSNFTHIMSIEGAEHFDTREKFFHEAYRVLKPGGILVISDYSLKHPPRNILEKFIAESARILWKVPKANVYTSNVFREKLIQVGFKNVEVQEVGALTIPGYYFEQKRRIKEVAKIRGFIAGRLGFIIDIAVYKAFQMGLLEYVLVKAEKSA
jgi:ubiquinone/menaquinone biosynthesis C-methylase UbiE